MSVHEWQQLTPDAAAEEVHARIRQRLSPPQQRAVLAWVESETRLRPLFAGAQHGFDQPLAGVPFFVKDLFDISGVPTKAGATFLPEVRPAPPGESALVAAMRRAGGVCAGKTHLHEFAYGITGENPHYGDCEHPRFPGRTTGGSSSGSAAIVAAGIAPVALGTDTGGSIRVPAAFCGIFGLRLAPGDGFIRDAFPLARSLDTAGWFTATATDMRRVLAALVGIRPSHSALRGCHVELPGLDPEVAHAFRAAAERYAPEADPATRDDLQRGFAPALPAYNTIVALEAWQVHQSWADKYRNRYDPAVWQRLHRVHALTTSEVAAAEATLAAVRLLWAKFFLSYDFLVLPATPCGALTKRECTPENRSRLLALTAPASLGGLPVLTIPINLPSGLSTGLQIVVNQPHSPALFAALGRAEEEALGIAA